jgi:hypothetical protein
MEMLHRLIRGAGVAAVAASLLGTTAMGALAHDVHTFGKFTIALGWLHEPAYVGFDNAVQVLVKDAAGNAYTNITDKDLTVEVSLGGQKMAAKPMLPTADPDTGLGLPGEYEMHFIPTAPGNYTFHLKGSVGGQAVDETVTASDKTFNTVAGAADVEFPNVVPANSELATKIDRLSSRLDQAAGSSAVTTLSVVSVLGILLGILAVGLSVRALRRRP